MVTRSPTAKGPSMKRETEMPQVRICAYPAKWLLEDGFANSRKIIWSTGRGTEIGEIQVIAVSSTLGDTMELKNDRRRDSVNSIWRATTPPRDEFSSREWPVQAAFRLLIRLQNPVPKADLVRAGLLKGRWPRHWQGKVLRDQTDIEKLANILAERNPKQRKSIFRAFKI